jgi:uncharacterized membrane protein YhaH (DUF805 family)
MFKNPFSFSGRVRRTEYVLSLLIYVIAGGLAQFFTQSASQDEEQGNLLFFFLFFPILWFMIAQGAKRCHDRGNTGWFQLIPFYGLWMLFADSEIGTNKYGANPKGIGTTDEIDEIGNYLTK